MIHKLSPLVVVAICTGGALVAFAFDQSRASPSKVSEVALYLAAAVICLLPVCVAVWRHGAYARRC
jgi:hypothetical protein